MKAIEFLDLLTREGLCLEQCGMAKGDCINANTPESFFGIIEILPDWWFIDDARYFYFYAERGFTFAFLPKDWWFFLTDDETGVYVWKIDD